MLPQVGIEPRPLWLEDYPFWTSEARAAEEIFKLLFMHHLFFGHKCQLSPERIVLNLESEDAALL